MMVSNRNLLFQGSIFRFHVCFGGCILGNNQPIKHSMVGCVFTSLYSRNYPPIVGIFMYRIEIYIYFGLSPLPVIVEMKVYRDSLLKM